MTFLRGESHHSHDLGHLDWETSSPIAGCFRQLTPQVKIAVVQPGTFEGSEQQNTQTLAEVRHSERLAECHHTIGHVNQMLHDVVAIGVAER